MLTIKDFFEQGDLRCFGFEKYATDLEHSRAGRIGLVEKRA